LYKIFKIMESIKLDSLNLLDSTSHHISEKIRKNVICIRPGHKSGLPRIYCENKGEKVVSHNYGHSGVGYSILFATVDNSIENYQKHMIETYGTLSYDTQITVVGLGCVGLTTALSLYHRGYKNITIIGESVTNTPSMLAGGLFEFSLTTIYKPEQIDYMNRLFKFTFLEYKKILDGRHKFITKGVKYVDYYTDYYQEGAGLSYLSGIGLIPKPVDKIVKFSDNGPELNVTHFKTLHINTSVFMMNLIHSVKKLKIPIILKKVIHFDEIKSKSIFNCTGLGSYYLNNDKDCYPICGHGFLLKDTSLGKHNFILRLVNVLEDSPSSGSLYFMPKVSGFIGGSYMPTYSGDDENVNKEVINKLIERSKYIFNGIKPKF
jgi:hypothetical protein